MCFNVLHMLSSRFVSVVCALALLRYARGYDQGQDAIFVASKPFSMQLVADPGLGVVSDTACSKFIRESPSLWETPPAQRYVNLYKCQWAHNHRRYA